MRIQLGILACLLAGCASQPTTVTDPATVGLPAPMAASDAALDASIAPAPLGDFVPRIGLEFLPPDDRFPEREPVEVESPRPVDRRRAPTPSERALRTVTVRQPEPSRLPSLAEIDFAAIDDPIARETLNFCSDLVAADRQRVRREVGIPFFDFSYEDPERGPLLTSERRLRQEHELWSQEHGTRLLRRPLRLLARRLPIARHFEVAVQEFRSENVPLSEPYRQAHGDRRRLGRLSMRVHVRDFEDPVEMVYIHPSGVRIGSSRERAKLSLDFALSDDLQLSLRARTNYETGDTTMRTDLVYRPSPRVSVHLAAGDDMEFLSTSSLYSLFESPMDGRAGVLLYAVHTF